MSLLSRFLPAVLAAGWLLAPVAATAAELVLTNGDRIEGELVRVGQSKLFWQSDNFGELSIAKSKVANFSSTEPVKVQGNPEPCRIQGMEAHYVSYLCNGSEQLRQVELLALDSIVPFAEHETGGMVFTGKTSVSGTFTRGNTIKDDLDIDAEASWRLEDFRHSLMLDYNRDRINDEPSVEDYETRYRADWFFKEQWYWYNELSYGQDESANVGEWYGVGTGLGVQLWENPESALALESGLDYLKERLIPTDAQQQDPTWDSSSEHASWRFASDFRYQLPFSASLFNTNELLYSLEDAEDWEFSAELGLNMPLGPGLFSEYKFEYDYDNSPASSEAEREDTKFTVGIGYQW